MAQIKSINLIHGTQSGERPIRGERLSSFWRPRLLIICMPFFREPRDWLLLCITAGSSGVSGQTKGPNPSSSSSSFLINPFFITPAWGYWGTEDGSLGLRTPMSLISQE